MERSLGGREKSWRKLIKKYRRDKGPFHRLEYLIKTLGQLMGTFLFNKHSIFTDNRWILLKESYDNICFSCFLAVLLFHCAHKRVVIQCWIIGQLFRPFVQLGWTLRRLHTFRLVRSAGRKDVVPLHAPIGLIVHCSVQKLYGFPSRHTMMGGTVGREIISREN